MKKKQCTTFFIVVFGRRIDHCSEVGIACLPIRIQTGCRAVAAECSCTKIVATIQVIMGFAYSVLFRLKATGNKRLAEIAPRTHPIHCNVRKICGARYSSHLSKSLLELGKQKLCIKELLLTAYSHQKSSFAEQTRRGSSRRCRVMGQITSDPLSIYDLKTETCVQP